tara:strand:- start:317 stop:607 length:291 start_codon:yes stop_codon:yes gene_type:complete
LSVVKSEIVKKLSDNYPNFLKRDIKRVIDIFLDELKNSLKRKERVELRNIFSLEPKLQRSKYSRNPKTNEKIFVNKKYTILFKSSKSWLIKINEKK